MRKLSLIFPILFALCLLSPECYAQVRRIADRRQTHKYGTLTVREKEAPDSLTLARLDSLARADSLHREDSIAVLGKSSLDRPAFSTAKDSILEVFRDGRRLIYYYGDVSVKYQDMELTAGYMEYDMNLSEVYAKGVFDTLKQEWTGQPVMTQGGQTYNMEEVRYNFNTHRALIKNMDTEEDEGVLHGENIKMMEDKSINMTHGVYTLCDAPEPHYYLKLSMGKVITEPTRKTVFGPANLVVGGVNLPFIGLPFGFVPERPERATGILMPTFGEEENRGFYLRDLGMYFAIGNHVDISVTGDIYSLGSWALDLNSRYKFNYKFNGNLTANYSYNKLEGTKSGEYDISTDFGLKWTHTQDSKARPGTNFSASVNFSTPTNNRYNSRSLSEAMQNQVRSSISYSRNWNGKFNLSLNLLHSQTNNQSPSDSTRDASYSFSLPNITFSMSTIYPFKKKNRVGKESALEKISFGYGTSLQNTIGFKASEFNLKDPDFVDKFQTSMNHNFNIGLPSFQLLKYLNFNPSISYGMNWYFRQKEASYNAEKDTVEVRNGHMFGSFGLTQQVSGGISMSTRLYSMFNFGQGHKINAIRHVISPSVSMSFSPDQKTALNGYRTLEYTDKKGRERTYNYNVYEGLGGSVPGNGKSASASFTINNNIEAKVRDFADTTGKGTKIVKLIDNLSLSGSYNFLADSMKMSEISLTMGTNLFNKISLNARATFDPYGVDSKGIRHSRYAVTEGQGLVRFTAANISASWTMNGKGEINGFDGTKSSGGGSQVSANSTYQRVYKNPLTGENIPGGWLYYTNPSAPWSINLSASFTYLKGYDFNTTTGELSPKNKYTATLSASGSLRLSPRLNMNCSSGYDFIAHKITPSQFSFTYDLHCFNISVSWVPTGFYKSYSFRIAANASALADLLTFRKSNSYMDNY